MKNSNVYSALLDVLQRQPEGHPGVLFGTLTSTSPLTIRVGDTDIDRQLFYPRGMVFHVEQIGREMAVFPCENGFLILFEVEGGNRI